MTTTLEFLLFFLPSFAQNYFNNIVTKLVSLIIVAMFFVDDVYNNGG
jgi:hypothetical protein